MQMEFTSLELSLLGNSGALLRFSKKKRPGKFLAA
jgi:hypothetical protein